MDQLDRHTFPSGGWVFRQPQTGWAAPTPIASTFDQTVVLIIQHRMKNPAITTKHNLPTDPEVVGEELLKFNRLRLGIPEPPPRQSFFAPSRSLPERVVAAAANLRRAAQGTSVWMDWLAHGGVPVDQALAEKRAQTCVDCPRNQPGEWYVEAPATLLKSAIEEWKKVTGKDFKFDTAQGDKLKSCGVCLCLSKIKVFVPMTFISQRTKPEIMSEFPRENCWVARRDQ